MGITVTDKIITTKDRCESKYKDKFDSRCSGGCGIIITKYTNWKDEYESFSIHHAHECVVGDEEYAKGLSEWQLNNGFDIVEKKEPVCVCGADKVNTTHSDWCVKYDSNR